MKRSNLTKAQLIALLNKTERRTVRARVTRIKREALLLARDINILALSVFRAGQASRRVFDTYTSNLRLPSNGSEGTTERLESEADPLYVGVGESPGPGRELRLVS